MGFCFTHQCLNSVAGISHPKQDSSWGSQFSSVQSLSHVRLCDPMNHSTPGLPVHHQLPESAQTHVRWVSNAIQPSHPLSFPSPLALNLSQHQGLFKWLSSSHQETKVLELQLQDQSFIKTKYRFCNTVYKLNIPQKKKILKPKFQWGVSEKKGVS